MKTDLFSTRPHGFDYHAEFLAAPEERDVLREVERLPFKEVRMHGMVAKRRVFHFGLVYGYESWKLTPGPPLPEFLLPLRHRIAPLLNCDPDDVAEVLVTKYPAGAGIGWHRDAPMFGPAVVGISLLSRAVSDSNAEATRITRPSKRSWSRARPTCCPATREAAGSIRFRRPKGSGTRSRFGR